MIQNIAKYILFTSDNMTTGVTDIFTNALWHQCLLHCDDVMCLIELILKYESNRIQIVLKTSEYPLCRYFCTENEPKGVKIDLY